MPERQPMYFYVTPTSAEPVGPKAAHTCHGRPRKPHTIEEASRACGWPAVALIALHDAVYPPQPDVDDRWIDHWAEALFLPAVRDRLAFWAKWLGNVPPESFLVGLLDDFDRLMGECKVQMLLRGLNVTRSEDDELGDHECRAHLDRLAAAREQGGEHG